jgi:hypothetical protein
MTAGTPSGKSQAPSYYNHGKAMAVESLAKAGLSVPTDEASIKFMPGATPDTIKNQCLSV